MDGEAMDTAKYNGMVLEDGVRLLICGGNGPDPTLPNLPSPSSGSFHDQSTDIQPHR